MSPQIDAIYEDGVFKPLVPITLPDKAHVRLTVSAAAQSANVRNVVQSETSVSNDAADDFGAQLDELLFDGPSLPADFSRADIYADHD